MAGLVPLRGWRAWRRLRGAVRNALAAGLGPVLTVGGTALPSGAMVAAGVAGVAANTAVPLLNGVEGTGTAGGLTVQGSLSCSDAGTVNKWEAAAAGTFGAVTSGSLGTGSWASPGCPVQEAFSSWPTMFTPVAYDAASDATANFTTSDGGHRASHGRTDSFTYHS